jgi:hypothetical protein
MAMPIERIGDDLFDTETGEYAGPANSTLPDRALETEEELLAYLNRLSSAEADVLAETKRLQAVVANVEKMLALKNRRVEWLKARYERSASDVAEGLLPRKPDGTFRTKTYTCPWGQVAFREVKSKVVVDNQQLAVAWAKLNAPESVKTVESVLVSKLPETFIERWASNEFGESNTPWGFTIEPGRNSVKVTTVSSSE